jgi:hypothetical protein
MFRISCEGRPIVVVGTVKAVKAAICSSEPGRYEIHLVGDKSPPAGQDLRRWGSGIKLADGSFEIELEHQ